MHKPNIFPKVIEKCGIICTPSLEVEAQEKRINTGSDYTNEMEIAVFPRRKYIFILLTANRELCPRSKREGRPRRWIGSIAHLGADGDGSLRHLQLSKGGRSRLCGDEGNAKGGYTHFARPWGRTPLVINSPSPRSPSYLPMPVHTFPRQEPSTCFWWQ